MQNRNILHLCRQNMMCLKVSVFGEIVLFIADLLEVCDFVEYFLSFISFTPPQHLS